MYSLSTIVIMTALENLKETLVEKEHKRDGYVDTNIARLG